MNANAENGKKYAITIGLYLIIKQVLNMIISGSLLGSLFPIILAVAMCFVLTLGVKYSNYVVAIIGFLAVLTNFKTNISNLGFNQYLIYMIEAILDVIAGVMLIVNADIKAHFEGDSQE